MGAPLTPGFCAGCTQNGHSEKYHGHSERHGDQTGFYTAFLALTNNGGSSDERSGAVLGIRTKLGSALSLGVGGVVGDDDTIVSLSHQVRVYPLNGSHIMESKVCRIKPVALLSLFTFFSRRLEKQLIVYPVFE